MTLNAWQERLDTQFAQLHEQRLGSQGTRSAIYALEHGLSSDEIDQLKAAVLGWVKNSSPSRRHSLVWAVYSAEVGYQYSGEEYWFTFRDLTPNWQDCQSTRDHIRDCFREFRKKYNVAKPHGPWADHFRIICWPITHAILPKDLQRELAYILYELRGSFTPGLLRDTELLGRRIEDASWNSRARFRQFAEQHLLVGQIATALLLSEEDKDKALILPTTLSRIAADLDKNQRSREWLGDARRRANQVRIRGLSRFPSAPDFETVSETGPLLSPRQREVLELGIEPDVFLERTGPDSWSTRLQLPSLAPLVQRFPRLRDVIANQRCVVAGAKGGPLPRGYLLYGTQTVTLSRWPSSDEVLLRFDNFDPELTYLLTMECLLRPGPTWLFKIGPDGATASHIKTGTVQRGADYILIARSGTDLPQSTLNSSGAMVDCDGISAIRLAVPDVITKIFQEQLNHLSISTSSEIQVAPVGIPARNWDDSGTAEWLSTDNPLIRISATFEVEGIILNLVGPTSNKLELTESRSWPLLVDLERLDPGVYNLHVLVSRPQLPAPTFGRLQFTIREPKPWTGSFPIATPFSAHISPAAPTMEDLWEEKATVELSGPPDRKAEGSLAFYRNSTNIYEDSFGPLNLPCSRQQWLEHWRALTANKCVENAYDASSECELTISCEELGNFRVRAIRDPKPVRWIVKQQNSRYFLTLELLDEHVQPALGRYSFCSPIEFAPLQENTLREFRVSEDGGLFAATADRFRDSVIIPPTIHSFNLLAAKVIMPQMPRSETSLDQVISGLEIWNRARAVGSQFAVDRKIAAIKALESELVRLACGDEWSRQEEKYHKGELALSVLKNFISAAKKHSTLSHDIFIKQESLQSSPLLDVVDTLDWLAHSHLDLSVFSTAREHGVSRQKWLTEFLYRLFMSPEDIRGWASNDFVPAVGYVLKNPVLARLVRIVYLISQTPQLSGAQRKAASV